jgi:hypothetical protein
MLYLPLPEPWAIDTLPGYIDQLVNFLEQYGDIARCSTRDAFTIGLPMDWVPEYSLEKWVEIVTGQCNGPFCDAFSKFVSLSRKLPLLDNRAHQNIPIESKYHRMSPKKCHEVDAMVDFVAEITKARNVTATNVLDVGSGLGYLCTALSNAGYQVSGVEGNEARAIKAAEQTTFRSIHKRVETYADLDILMEPCISLSLRIAASNVANVRCLWRSFVEHD